MNFKKLIPVARTLLAGAALAWSASLTAQSPNAAANPQHSSMTRELRQTPPLPLPAAWKGLIGEFDGDHKILNVLEKDGKLKILVGESECLPLEQVSANVFRFPASGSNGGDTVTFVLDSYGHAMAVKMDGAVFPRHFFKGKGNAFQIVPLKPIPELRREALAASPPVETGKFLPPDLVDVTTYDPTIKLDIRYATSRNFLGAPMYQEAHAFLQRPAAESLANVSRQLRPLGYGLLIHDAYRPWYVTKMFWDATPDDKKIFVANPAQGSRHNRGCALDLSLYDLKTGKPVEMTGDYDEMSDRSYAFYPGGTSPERWHRHLLRQAMQSEGFTVYEFEWWHFDYRNWQKYPILNLTFEQLDRLHAGAPHP